jgi:hypothetical protein
MIEETLLLNFKNLLKKKKTDKGRNFKCSRNCYNSGKLEHYVNICPKPKRSKKNQQGF